MCSSSPTAAAAVESYHIQLLIDQIYLHCRVLVHAEAKCLKIDCYYEMKYTCYERPKLSSIRVIASYIRAAGDDPACFDAYEKGSDFICRRAC